METLTKKTLDTKRGYTYTYYVSAAKSGKPTVLLCHGFPEHAAQWDDLATNHLVPAGYGVVVPDLLGYDGTSKPKDPAEYRFDYQSNDIAELLDAEGVEKVVSVGHDWGAGIAQRFYNYKPERTLGLSTLSVSYLVPVPGPMDLDAMRGPVEQIVGYFPYWYWYLFTDLEKGVPLMEANSGSFFDAAHCANPDDWLQTLCAKDGLKSFVEQGKTCERGPWATDKMKQDFVDRIKRDGLTGPTNWYRAITQGYQHEAEKALPKERFVVNVPYLFVATLKDRVCLPGAIEEPKAAGMIPTLEVEGIETGHWVTHEKPKELGEVFVKWLGKTF